MNFDKYGGSLYNLSEPTQAVAKPISFGSETRVFAKKSSLVKGLPVMTQGDLKSVASSSSSILGSYTEKGIKEKRYSLKHRDKTSAEVIKIGRQQADRLSFMKEHDEQKAQERLKMKREKEEELRQLKTYNPFGKPGFGAPRGVGMDKIDTVITKTLQGDGGVGMVRETDNHLEAPGDRYVTNLPRIQRYKDENLRRYMVNRETAEKYRKDLDTFIIEKQQQEKLAFDREKKSDNAMKDYNPFGKPGAGAPIRDENGIPSMDISNNFAETERTHKIRKELQKRMWHASFSLAHDITPDFKKVKKCKTSTGKLKTWGRYHSLSPEKSKSFHENDANNLWLKLGHTEKKEVNRFPKGTDSGIKAFLDDVASEELFPRRHNGGGGDPLVGSKGEKLTKRPGLLTTISGSRRTEHVAKVLTPVKIKRSDESDNPWGKPGAGAPLRNSQGDIMKTTKGRIKQETWGPNKAEEKTIVRGKQVYRQALLDGMDLQRHIREEEKNYLNLPPGDVPSWFSKGKVGRPLRDPLTGTIVPQKRVMSDITSQTLSSCKPKKIEDYYQELEKMAEEKYKFRYEKKQRLLQQQIKQHLTTTAFKRRPSQYNIVEGPEHKLLEERSVSKELNNSAMESPYQDEIGKKTNACSKSFLQSQTVSNGFYFYNPRPDVPARDARRRKTDITAEMHMRK